MTKNERRPVKFTGGFFRNISNEIKLVFKLLADPRISLLLKALPFGTLLYFIFPDLAPGPVDDAFVIGMGVYLFIELCPPEIVQEHRDALRKTIPGQWQNQESEHGDIIDSEFTEK
ncbi:MAG: hypothetical protein U9Q82_13135 [Chloroflexota bacterium]|nr:hypothetical protein [Chloroflexota bacterium]